MMKTTFLNIKSFMEQRLEKKPSGFNLFLKEMFTIFTRAFDDDAPVVWVSCYAFPMELLWAFDVVPFDFEIACNSLPAATEGNGSSVMTEAEKEGFSRGICSFYRLALGAQFQGVLPRGDLFLTSSYYCNGKAKTNEILAGYQGKESVFFDVPNEISDCSIRYVASQLRDIAGRLEAVTGEKLDHDRLKEAVRWSNRARASYQEVNDLMKAKPCPWDGQKASMLGISGSLFWGSPIRDRINRLLVREMEERVRGGMAFPEDYRILWFPWTPVQPTNIFQVLKWNRAGLVMTEKAQVYWSEIDEENPFEGLALRALENPFVGTAEKRVKGIVALAEGYDVDGAIHFSTPACYHETGSTRIISDALRDRGVPVLDLEGDMTDERNYSPDQTEDKLSSFFEILKQAEGS